MEILKCKCDFIFASLLAVSSKKGLEISREISGELKYERDLVLLSSPNFEQVKMLCSPVVSSKGYCSCLFFCQNINGWAWESIFTTISR